MTAPPRIAVYAIAKDEGPRVARWSASARDADALVLVDTGSTDDTVDAARALGIDVHEIVVEPFRFDEARNRALDLVPSDVDLCVPLDLDEELQPGWRAALDAAWSPGVDRITFRRTWTWSDREPPQRYRDDKIHARHGHRWVHPVHERTVTDGPETVVASDLEVVHHRDPAAPRPSYLELLQLAAAESPDDGRVHHMLANEYRMRGRPEPAAAAARRALELPLPTDELAHALLLMSWLEPDHAEGWIVAACQSAPDRREPWCELARVHLAAGEWRAAIGAVRAALSLVRPAEHYLENPWAWAQWPHVMGATAAEQLGDLDAAVRFARAACRTAPGDADAVAIRDRLVDRLARGGP
jgi:tetratricopeptide (TPR) repeat protein